MHKKRVLLRVRTFTNPIGDIVTVETGQRCSFFMDINNQTGFVVPNYKIPTSLAVLRYLNSISPALHKNWRLYEESRVASKR